MDETKRVVIDNYPVERLPVDVREHFPTESEVVLTVQGKATRSERRTITQILDAMQDERVAGDDPAASIRASRAEWDRRDELHERIRCGEKT